MGLDYTACSLAQTRHGIRAGQGENRFRGETFNRSHRVRSNSLLDEPIDRPPNPSSSRTKVIANMFFDEIQRLDHRSVGALTRAESESVALDLLLHAFFGYA